MFCPNCGNELNENEDFCPNCGTSISNVESETLTDQFSEKSSRIFGLIKTFIGSHKKLCSIVFGILGMLLVGMILVNLFYDFTKIQWNKDLGDFDVSFTRPKTIELYVIAYDEDGKVIEDIEFSCSKGEIVANGKKVEWTLPEEAGVHTITAKAPSGKKITKKVEVAKEELEHMEPVLAGVYVEEVDDSVTDNDNDGLTNAKEDELGTNKNLADTDGDGIPDNYELTKTNTNPLLKDTDNDGLTDGNELDLNLDPLKYDSKGDGLKDSDREVEITVDNEKFGVSAAIKGKGNIATTTIDVFENSVFEKREGILGKIYDFYTEGNIASATVKIKYDLEDIKNKGLNEDNLSLYYFNESTKQLEEILTVVDKANQELTATLSHFSKYVVADKEMVDKVAESNVLFVIDNSLSMYDMKTLNEYGYTSVGGTVGNDICFARVTLTNMLIEMFDSGYTFGVAQFAGEYRKIVDFTRDEETVKKGVESIKEEYLKTERIKRGTAIIEALQGGIDEFELDGKYHYLIFLTDGEENKGNLARSKDGIIEKAKEKDVKIFTIGLGKAVNESILSDIAEQTGGKYYNALHADALSEVYKLVASDINYNYVDTDGNNEVDGIIRADSGFIASHDGFSFKNFSSDKSEKGHCYGMAAFANLYYQNKLPESLDADKTFYLPKGWKTSNGYNLKNTYFSKKNKLYDFKFESDVLNKYFHINIGRLVDRVENDVLMLNKEYYDDIIEIGGKVVEVEYNGERFSKHQKPIISIDNETFNSAVKNEEAQLVNAIWRLFIFQYGRDKPTRFSMKPDKGFDELNSKLNSGDPVVIAFYYDGTGHAVNGIKLIQDITNSNKFKIEIYDNNYPGEVRYIDVTRTKFSNLLDDFAAWTNEYQYSFEYNSKEVTLELCYPEI